MPPPAPTLPIEERTGEQLESPSSSPGKRRTRQGRGGRWHRATSDITPQAPVEYTPTPYADTRWGAFQPFGGMMPMIPPAMPFPTPGYFPNLMAADPAVDPADFPKEAARMMWPQTPTPGAASAHAPYGFWLPNPSDRMNSDGAPAEGRPGMYLGEDEQLQMHREEPGGSVDGESQDSNQQHQWRVTNTFIDVVNDDPSPVGLQPRGSSAPVLQTQGYSRTSPSRAVGGPPPMQPIPEPTQEQVEDERLSIPVDCPEGMPSRGSAIHGSGKCRPCAWFHKPQGCQNYQQCAYCHICQDGELKQRKKAKVQAMRMGALEPANKELNNVGHPRVLKLGPLL